MHNPENGFSTTDIDDIQAVGLRGCDRVAKILNIF